MKQILSMILMCIPLTVLYLMYSEGGLLGVALYVGYSFGALILFKLPIWAVRLWK